MTTPLPPKAVIDTHIPTGIKIYGYNSHQMRAYGAAEYKRGTEALQAVTAERDALVAELNQPVPLSEWQQMVSERDALRLIERGMQITIDELKADAERYDYLLTKRLGWLSSRAPIPWNKQTTKEAMSAAIDLAMKGKS